MGCPPAAGTSRSRGRPSGHAVSSRASSTSALRPLSSRSPRQTPGTRPRTDPGPPRRHRRRSGSRSHRSSGSRVSWGDLVGVLVGHVRAEVLERRQHARQRHRLRAEQLASQRPGCRLERAVEADDRLAATVELLQPRDVADRQPRRPVRAVAGREGRRVALELGDAGLVRRAPGRARRAGRHSRPGSPGRSCARARPRRAPPGSRAECGRRCSGG